MGRVSDLNTPYAAFYTADEFVPWESVSMMIYVLSPFCRTSLGCMQAESNLKGSFGGSPPPQKIFFKGLLEIFCKKNVALGVILRLYQNQSRRT